MRANWKQFWLLFGVQFLNYCIVCISYIALSKFNYAVVAITDTLCCLNGFFIIKKVSSTDSKDVMGLTGYTLGGVSGSMLAIWISKRLVGV